MGNYDLVNEGIVMNSEKIDSVQVYVSVCDSGKDIPETILPKLFQKFFTDSSDGTGLGLYISKKLVEAMGGSIWAFNNPNEVGSTFVFSLPKAKYVDKSAIYIQIIKS